MMVNSTVNMLIIMNKIYKQLVCKGIQQQKQYIYVMKL
jgi:hypothetical protein